MKRVEYDINKSEYSCEVNDLEFYFSSEFNKMRFELNYSDYVDEETNKLQAKYHVNIDIYDYLLVAFYKRIEKRGFKVFRTVNNTVIRLDKDYVFMIR